MAASLLLSDHSVYSRQLPFELPEDAQLMHGIARNAKDPSIRMVHAWVESPSMRLVWDFSNDAQLVAPSRLYYEAGEIEVDSIVSFDRGEMREMLSKHEHYGPWHETPEGVR